MQLQKEAALCPKEVAVLLNISERTAQRLMQSGDIRSFRAGPKLLRTERSKVEAYKSRGFTRYARLPRA